MKVSLQEALARVPGAKGERFATVFERGSVSVEVYAPRGKDPQSPHTRDELVWVVFYGPQGGEHPGVSQVLGREAPE